MKSYTKNSPLDRRELLALGTSVLGSSVLATDAAALEKKASATTATQTPCMLSASKSSGFQCKPLHTTGDKVGSFRPVGIMDGLGAWRWDAETVRLFVSHELPADAGHPWTLTNGTQLLGARITWFDIDRTDMSVRDAGNAVLEIRDRRGEPVTRAEQINERWGEDTLRGLNTLCSAQGYKSGEFGFVDDLFFAHEEVSAKEDHPHGGSIWALDIREGTLWALPELGRGSWENVTAIATPDMAADDGHVALLLGDDLEFGGAPLYLWVGEKQPGGNILERNGLAKGRLYAWSSKLGDSSPEDWNGTGSSREGLFIPLHTRRPDQAGKAGYDRDGYLDDVSLRAQAFARGAFQMSRPEDLHTNPANPRQAVLCSTGHGKKYPSDDWGTVYLIEASVGENGFAMAPTATLTILHDCDDFGDYGIRSPDNVVWASDGYIYIHEDMATKLHPFGSQTGREASTWRIDPANPEDYKLVAVIDRGVVLPADAKDIRPGKLGAWECCGLLDVTAEFEPEKPQLLMITAVQAHTVRNGSLGGRDDLVQGGQLVLMSRST